MLIFRLSFVFTPKNSQQTEFWLVKISFFYNIVLHYILKIFTYVIILLPIFYKFYLYSIFGIRRAKTCIFV